MTKNTQITTKNVHYYCSSCKVQMTLVTDQIFTDYEILLDCMICSRKIWAISNRRKEERREERIEAHLSTASRLMVPIFIVDISKSGLKVLYHGHNLKPGDKLMVEYCIADKNLIVKDDCVVRCSDKNYLGLELARDSLQKKLKDEWIDEACKNEESLTILA